MSREKTAEDFLVNMWFEVKTPSRDYIDKKYVIQAMQAYADQHNAALKESLAELIPIAEFHQQHLMHYSIVFPAMREKALEYKAAIDRAKKLIAENREQSPKQPPQEQES